MRLPTVPRATGFGVGAAAVAIILWFAYANWPRAFVLPYAIALCATAAAGAYILLATWYDTMRNPRRGTRIRPIRGFDITVGLMLLLPSAWALSPFLPAI